MVFQVDKLWLKRPENIVKERKVNIEAFLLCECATESQGKLNVLGAFANISAKQMPIVYPACAIAGRIRFSRIEQGEHEVRVSLIDQDGKEIIPALKGNISVKVRDDGDSSVVNFILHVQRLKLEKYGDYRVDLAIDGRQEASLPLYVRKTREQS